MNGVLDADETDVDCDGACGATCATWARCDWHNDCAGAGICAEEPSADDFDAPSTCRPRVEACSAGACGSDLCFSMQTNLDPAGSSDTVVYYCERIAQVGAACRYSDDKDVRTCVAGAACIVDPSELFVERCALANIAPGAVCTDDTCVDGYFCDRSDFGQVSTCEPQRGLGAWCLNSVDCGAGLHCDVFRNARHPLRARRWPHVRNLDRLRLADGLLRHRVGQ